MRGFARVYTPPGTVTEETNIRWFAKMAMAGREPFAGVALELRMTAYLPIPESWSAKRRAMAARGETLPIVRPDFDNIAKLVDALAHIVWRDDAQVTDAHILKRYAAEPRLEIEVSLARIPDLLSAADRAA